MNTNNIDKVSPPLQKNAELLPSIITIKPATFVPLNVDAKLELHGVTWYRVHGGFGGKFDREDWIADLPGIAVSVCDYNWNGQDFGLSYGSFEDACLGELERGLRHAKQKKVELQIKLSEVNEAISLLEKVCSLE